MIEVPIIVTVGVYFARSGYPITPVYGDLDNLLKAVFDGMVKVGILADDRYIVGCETWKAADTEDWFDIYIHEARHVV